MASNQKTKDQSSLGGLSLLDTLSAIFAQSATLRDTMRPSGESGSAKVVPPKTKPLQIVTDGARTLTNARTLATTPGPGNLLASAAELVNAVIDYAKVAQVERTKRTQISAWRDTRIQEIEAERELLTAYVAQVFAERQEVLHNLLSGLEAASAATQPEQMQVLLQGILVTVQANPIKKIVALRQKMETGPVNLDL